MGAFDLQTRLFVLLRKICFSNAVLFSSNENPTRRVSSRRLDGAALTDFNSTRSSQPHSQCLRGTVLQEPGLGGYGKPDDELRAAPRK